MESTEPAPEKKKKSRLDRVIRKGSVENDAEFAQQNRVYQKLFVERLGAFTAKDPELTMAFANDWLQAIETLTDQPTDELMQDYIQQKVGLVEEWIAKVMVFITDLEFFAGKAFPNDKRMPFEFGFDLLQKESVSTNPRFIIYCFAAQEVAGDYETLLIAKGLPANWRTDFDVLLTEGPALYVQLEMTKRYRIRATTARVKAYDNLYEFWKRIARTAAVIYRTQPEVAGLWSRG